MANGISTAIRINDGMSPALKSMNKALMVVLNTFESMQSATADPINTAAISEARSELARVEATLQDVKSNANGARSAMSGMPDEISDATEKAHGLNGVFQRIKETAAGVVIGNLVTGAISKAGDFLKQSALGAVEYASDLTEVQNVVDVTFGNMADSINKWAEGTLHAVGLNELSAKQYAGTMGAMLKSSGITGDAVAKMSTNITELAGDMASFYNLSGDEAFEKIRAGISGETEPLKQLGINMSVANMEAYALSQGIETSYDKMNQAQQTLLRYNYLLSVTGDAQGDFARTQDSYANQTKLLSETWRDFTGQLASYALPTLTNIVTSLNGFISNMTQYVPVIVSLVGSIGSVLGSVADGFMWVYSIVADNWSLIAPIIGGVAAGMLWFTAVTKGAALAQLAYAGIQSGVAAVMGAFRAVQTFVSIGWGVLTGNTAAASAAQFVFNSALLACPLTWILLIIIAVIAAIYLVVAAINKVTGSTISATGIIAGAFSWLGALIYNVFVGIVDIALSVINYLTAPWVTFANFFGNLFNDPLAAIIHAFGDMADAILGILEGIARAIDAVFGSNLADAVSGWRGSLDSKIESFANEKGNGSYEKVMENVNLTSESLGLKRKELGKAYDSGYKWGEGVADKVSNFSMDSVWDKLGLNKGDTSALTSTGGSGLGGYSDIGTSYDDLAGNVGDIKDNTGGIKDAVDVSEEDLKYLRDIAEQEAINRFTTAEISVDFGGVSNTINNDMDIDGFMDVFTDRLYESMTVAAEGLHS